MVLRELDAGSVHCRRREFRPVLESLGNWGQRRTVRVQRWNLDAGFLIWNVRRCAACQRLPDPHVVVHFRFSSIARPHGGRASDAFGPTSDTALATEAQTE